VQTTFIQYLTCQLFAHSSITTCPVISQFRMLKTAGQEYKKKEGGRGGLGGGKPNAFELWKISYEEFFFFFF
jgi:hypothetical protein